MSATPSISIKNEENFQFKDEPVKFDPVHEYPVSAGSSAIVIDNGSYNCRAGWSIDESPRLIFKNLIAKQRNRKELEVLVGNDIGNLEMMRWTLKSPFDKNVVTHYETQELVFDYIFSHLGITSDGSVNHPIVLTEPFCNPNYCRQQMSELLFECYHVPLLLYGNDALFSFRKNITNIDDALILSLGYNTLHVLPVLGGMVLPEKSRRINNGGFQMNWYMQRLLQLRYPMHVNSVSMPRAEELVRSLTHISSNYCRDLALWSEEKYYIDNVIKIQLPHPATAVTAINEEQQQERRRQNIKRLKEINLKRREAKLASDQEMLQKLISLMQLQSKNPEAFQSALESYEMDSYDELQASVNEMNNSVNRQRNHLDATLESVESKTKKHKETKIAVLLQQASELKGRNLAEFVKNIRKDHADLSAKRNNRKQRRFDMARRRTIASQRRMKMITELAQGRRGKKDDKKDLFGQNDDDWNVYKEINKNAGDSDSDAELEKLDEYESILREYDHDFRGGNEGPKALTEDDVRAYYQLHVGVEKTRVPEVIFQPSLIGMEQAGLVETIDFVLRKFDCDEQARMCQCIFLTGGVACVPGLWDRMLLEMQAIRPYQSSFSFKLAEDPSLDSWRGAREVAASNLLQLYGITLADYEEKGADFIKSSPFGNVFVPTPSQPEEIPKINQKMKGK